MNLDFEPDRGFGIYIHWPFCAKICPYCDFNVYAAKNRDNTSLIEAISADLNAWRLKTGARKVRSIFLGGGTPSLMPVAAVSSIIDRIDNLWGLEEGAEITLEANPDDRKRLPEFAKTGINRLSLGIQSLDTASLKFLGRTHSPADALDAVQIGKSSFKSISLDFIYALPGQSLTQWEGELDAILALEADHLSPYELTIESKTPFGKAVERGEWDPADEDISADLFDLTQELTEDAGYPAYEISNHARGEVHQSKHNKNYWRSGDWLGIGPGAHGRVTYNGRRYATIAPKRPENYINGMLASSSHENWDVETLNIEDIADERILMGLRMHAGVSVSDYENLVGKAINPSQIHMFEDDGLLESDHGTIRLTDAGRLLADYVSTRLVQ